MISAYSSGLSTSKTDRLTGVFPPIDLFNAGIRPRNQPEFRNLRLTEKRSFYTIFPMRHRCSTEDIAQLFDSLSHDKGQGPHLAKQILEGAVTVLRSDLLRSVELGILKHGWYAAGSSAKRLIVQNSVEGLRSWNSDEGRDHVWKIHQRMEDLMSGLEAKPLVMGWDQGEWVLKDGNYTAAALYHTWVARPPKPIRVFTLCPIQLNQPTPAEITSGRSL